MNDPFFNAVPQIRQGMRQSGSQATKARGVLNHAEAFPSNVTLLPLLLGLSMTLIIAGTVLVGKTVALASIPLFIIAIICYAFRDLVSAIAVFIAYAAMEGMFKYLTEFSQIVYAIKPLLSLLLLLIWALLAKRSGARTMKGPLAPWVAGLAIWGLVEAFNPLGGGVLTSILALWVWYIAPTVLYFLVINIIKDASQIRMICFSIVAITVVVSGFAVVQYAMGQSWTTAHLPGYTTMRDANWFATDAKGNVTTSSWEPASTGATSGGGAGWAYLGIIVMLGLFLSPATTRAQKIALSFCFIVNVTGLLVSGIRLYVTSSILVSLILLALLSGTPRQLLRSFAVAGAVLVFVGIGFNIAQSSSNGIIASRYAETLAHPVAKVQQDRGGNFSYLLPFLTAHPLGVGFQRGTEIGTYSTGKTGLSLNRETQFNSISQDLGAPGLVILIVLLSMIVMRGFRTFKSLSLPPLKVIAAVMFVLLLGYIMQCFGGPTLQSADTFWLIIGLATTLPLVERSTLRSAK